MNALRILLVLLAVALIGLLGWRMMASRVDRPASPQEVAPPGSAPTPLPSLQAPRSSEPAGETAEERLADVPEFAGFYGKLKTDFPHEYAMVVDRLSAAQRPGPSAPSNSGDVVIWDALRNLQQDQGVLASQADAGSLDSYFDARLAMLEGLAPLNSHDCVDFLYGMTAGSISDFTASHRGLVATLAERQIAVIESGKARHADRTVPTEEDFTALTTALTARDVKPDEISLLLDGTTPDPPIPDARLCDLGRLYLDALRGLPSGSRQRIYGLAAELLARS